VGSAVGLDVEDVDLKERMVHVRRAKGDHGYTTYLSEGVARALEGTSETGLRARCS
jgi:integrase